MSLRTVLVRCATITRTVLVLYSTVLAFAAEYWSTGVQYAGLVHFSVTYNTVHVLYRAATLTVKTKHLCPARSAPWMFMQDGDRTGTRWGQDLVTQPNTLRMEPAFLFTEVYESSRLAKHGENDLLSRV